MRPRSAVLAAVLLLGALGRAHADPLEPPPETPEGADYEAEPVDSLDDDHIEVSFSASGRSDGAPRRTRRLRFNADSLGASVREGTGDPLAGGSLEGRTRGGTFGIGRLAPRWGRGLLLGSAAEPWGMTADDRGDRAAFRGRSGDGAWLRGGEAVGYELVCGRFARRNLAGFSAVHREVGLLMMGDGRGGTQAGLTFARGGSTSEWGIDRRGRWRAESALLRSVGAWSFGGRVRGGHALFRSLAEPQRSGPAAAMTMGVSGPLARANLRAVAALWRYRAALGGARAALEADLPVKDGRLVAGVEEQHGLRREPTSAAGFKAGGFRQGWWAQWRGDAGPLNLALRHEAWGARQRARDPVRTVTSVAIETRSWAGAIVRVTHAVFRVRSGESVYLPEAESDRVVLRAVSGTGDRTRLEVRLPAAGGRVNASVGLASKAGSAPAKPRWTVDWTRRSGFRHRR